MSEKNVSAQVAPSIYKIMSKMRTIGLTQDNLITLIHRETKGTVSRTKIQATLDALRKIEKQLREASLDITTL